MKWPAIDAFLSAAVKQGVFPGVAVSAGNLKEIQYEHYAGVVEGKDSAQIFPATYFDLASLTKILVTGPLLAQTVSEGRVKLDEPARAYLPQIERPFTVRHLLTHSSGLPDWRPLYEKVRENTTYEEAKGEMLRAIEEVESEARPGEEAIYSDLGFILLGFLLEAVWHENLGVLARKRIFSPLGLQDTSFGPVAGRSIAATGPCPVRKKVLRGEVNDLNAWALKGVAGHAGVFAPLKDLSRFAQAVLANLKGEEKICSVATWREFTRRQNLPLSSTWALGWDTPSPQDSSAGKRWSKNGIGHLGFTGTSLWIDFDRDFFVVCLSNRVYPDAQNVLIREFRPALHNLVMEQFFPT